MFGARADAARTLRAAVGRHAMYSTRTAVPLQRAARLPSAIQVSHVKLNSG